MALDLEAIKARDAAVHSQTEDAEVNLLLSDRHELLARVQELEAAIRLMCDGCESSGIAACQSCPLYPCRGER